MNTKIASRHKDPLSEAIDLAKSGKKVEARQMLLEECLANPANAKAWLWRASLAGTVSEAVTYLDQVLVLDPDNATAHAWLERLRPPLEVPVYQCFLCSHEGPEEFTRCPQCHSLLSLDLYATFHNKGVDERQVRQAVDHFQNLTCSGDSFDIEYFLGVAYLNLLNSHAALEHFRRAAPLDERGVQLNQVITALSRRPFIMAVDDCLTIRTMVAHTLERNGFRCLGVASSVDALSYLEETTPDFILLDVSMPFMDGYTLAKAIKSRPKTKNVTIVMLSAKDGFLDKVKGRMAGASDYLTKPFEPALLLRVIQKYIPSKE